MAPITAHRLDLATAADHVVAAALRAGPVDPVGAVGLELEGHLVDRAVPADRVPWTRVLAAVAAVPPLPGGSRVTVEPGGQVELSGPPLPGPAAAVAALRADVAVLAGALAADGLAWVTLGADPLRPPRRVSPGPRYVAMEEHFAAVGCAEAGRAMMTATAALQVNLDAGPAAGWADRVGLAHRLGPVLVAVSACSRVVAGRDTGWASGRQQVWGDLDQARCGPLLGGRDPAGEWAAYALSAPVMLVRSRDGGAEPVRGRVAFADWVTGEARLGNRAPTLADLDYHLTTLFPPVRLRGFLEVRYLDAAPARWWPALAAVTAVLLDDPRAADRAADATAPVAGRWTAAARDGLADPTLRAAATACLAAALDAVPADVHADLRADIAALAELAERGRCPGDAVAERIAAVGPAAALLEEAA